jgi:acetyltransferase
MPFLTPTSIAVVGASEDTTKVGHFVMSNLLTQGYGGAVYPVNPKHAEIMGKKAYVSVKDLPETPEMVVIVTPAATVSAIARDCAEKGVKTLVVISAGFGELGTEEGHRMETELKEIAAGSRMQLVGPNCLGIIRPSIKMNASFAAALPKQGRIALLSQSGALAVALMDGAEHLGFSLVISMGNKTTMDECDFLSVCAEDSETHVIGLYLESINDGKRFLETAARIAQKKPVVLIKSGTSEKGKHAVSSHTGALAGSDAAVDAICREAGIHRAHTTEEFLDLLEVLSMCPPLLSPQIAVITNAGGPGILATDAAEREHLVLAPLTAENKTALKAKLPPAASVENPIDVLGDALEDRYRAALETALDDPGVDGVVTVLTPQIITPVAKIAEAIADAAKTHPLVPVVASFMGGESVKEGVELLAKKNIPNFATPEAAMRALRALQIAHSGLRKTRSESAIRNPQFAMKANALVHGKTGLLDEQTVAKLFALYDLPLPAQAIARSAKEAVAHAKKIGYPVIAKVSAPEIIHKTDVGGVRANLRSAKEVERAFNEIKAATHVSAVLIQEYLPVGHEFIVGALRDDAASHLILVGLGGIYTELFRDTSFRIAPTSEEEAYDMLQDLRSWKLLLGLRGKEQSDITSLARTVAAISRLVLDCPQIRELDLNPVLVRPDGIVIADAKIILG